MPRTAAAFFLLAALFSCRRQPTGPVAPYADSRICANCHPAIDRSYRETGMARAFAKASRDTLNLENWGKTFDHRPSGRVFELDARDGRYFLRRWESGKTNLVEREIHYVMGSGNHARSYIHRTAEGRLSELPVAWYPGVGFAMSPGYDRPDHQDVRRKISFDCMFCHNAYPALPPGADQPASEPVWPAVLPEGIDCQRCHGPGRAHAESAGKAAIVNPKKLPRERSLEVCMQCHLETTSTPLPNSLVRFGRGAFSYKPGEPLGAFVIHFDHAQGREEKFEIVSSAYRLRQSRCFSVSGTLQCTTCHDPHQVQRGSIFDARCKSCHASGPHSERPNCASCHMPRRRTEDVVHAVMTDHKIQRRPSGNLLATLRERHEAPGRGYRGEVALYHPPDLDERTRDIYLGIAQVVQKSNPSGAARLEAAIVKHAPREPQPYFALAPASGRPEEWYRKALDRDPSFVPAMRNLGEVLNRAGRHAEALTLLERARTLAPRDPSVLHELGLAYRCAGRLADAAAALRESVKVDPEFPEAINSLGLVLAERSDPAAEAAFREAIRIQPDYAESHLNLARILLSREQTAAARRELETAIRWKPGLAPAHEALGGIAAAEGRWAQSLEHYRESFRLDPSSDHAALGVGSALAALGNRAAAATVLERAARSADPGISSEAREVLSQLKVRP
jgi:tetratricopeptide (TPR) repeat protein